MVFYDVVREDPYDVWIGDEAWELDYFLHENPELKSAAYVWLTDFVGWLPMPDSGERERFLTADYNAEMLDQIARYPRVRDRSIFVGDPDDIVHDSFGPDLPPIREWTEHHFDFAGYITGFDHTQLADRNALRAELGYRPGERVCIVTVGGSGVGSELLRRVIASYPEAKRLVPGLRMIVVAGPRIDPDTLPTADGLEIWPYVHDLYRHLAACDLAIVQGGLTTTMELTATRRPFIYFPLEHHFEQNLHVRHRLERYGAGRRMDYRDSPPDAIAAAIAQEIGREVDYRAGRHRRRCPGGGPHRRALVARRSAPAALGRSRAAGDGSQVAEQVPHQVGEVELVGLIDPPFERDSEDSDPRLGGEARVGLRDTAPAQRVGERRGQRCELDQLALPELRARRDDRLTLSREIAAALHERTGRLERLRRPRRSAPATRVRPRPC